MTRKGTNLAPPGFGACEKHNMRMKEENLEKDDKLKDKQVLQLLKTQQRKRKGKFKMKVMNTSTWVYKLQKHNKVIIRPT